MVEGGWVMESSMADAWRVDRVGWEAEMVVDGGWGLGWVRGGGMNSRWWWAGRGLTGRAGGGLIEKWVGKEEMGGGGRRRSLWQVGEQVEGDSGLARQVLEWLPSHWCCARLGHTQ